MQNQKKNNIRAQSIELPFLLMIILFIGSCVFFFSPVVQAETNEISEIYIDATGNNKYEAKIKAHKNGMYRALHLVADKLNIPTEGLRKIPYHKIRPIFSEKSVLNEVSLLERYNATVTYSYDKGKLYSLLLEYGDEKINDLFYELVVIPVFKQNESLSIWDKDRRWNDFWRESTKILDAHKIYYPEKTLFLSEKITESNLFSLKYDDFVNILHDKFFKNVMIVTAEFMTNRKDGSSILKIKKYILNPAREEAEIFDKEYDLNSWEDIPRIVDLSIDKIIDDYGVSRLNSKENNDDGHLFIDKDETKPIIMSFDVFDDEELNLVVSKLENVDQIDSFEIKHDYETRYKILIYTSVSEYELAEGLYLNGLSYRIHGNLYNLIDIRKGA